MSGLVSLRIAASSISETGLSISMSVSAILDPN